MTIKSFAEKAGITERRVRQLVSDGVLTRQKRGVLAKDSWQRWTVYRKNCSTTMTPLRNELLKEQIRRLKLQNDLEAGRLVPLAYIHSRHNAIGSRVGSILRQKLEIEYPNAAAGLDVRGARVYGKRLSDQIMLEFQKLGDVFTA